MVYYYVRSILNRAHVLSFFITLLFFLQPIHAYQFLTLSDIHYGSDNTPGDGHDTDSVLLTSALKAFSDLSVDADFILLLGDLPTHQIIYSPKKETYIKTVLNKLVLANHAAKPMFYITGNNDSLAGNYQPFSWKEKTPLSLTPQWHSACLHCDGLMIDDTHLQDKGYYSTYVLPGHKDILLIALNSIQFTRTPLLLPNYPHQKQDALQQLQWLGMQLKKHHAKQLLIAMHVPPGNDYKGRAYWHSAYLKQFLSLLNQAKANYEEISLLTSHSHMDEIHTIHLAQGKTIYAYSTPSISRVHHNNPGMKRFELNQDMKIQDITTYYTLTDSPWQNKHYSMIKHAGSLFPKCHGQLLVPCLNTMSDEFICKRLIEGEFYGVKSPRVTPTRCPLTL